eukprot:scpid64070/ scgid30668/ Zinc finger protein 277; Nuclear receptor-interacting factor 4
MSSGSTTAAVAGCGGQAGVRGAAVAGGASHTLGGGDPATAAMAAAASRAHPCPCLMCSESFNVCDSAGKQYLLRHLLIAHHVVIGEVDEVLDLPVYCSYWQQRLAGHQLTEFMAVIRTNTKAPTVPTPEKYVAPQETYYLLNKALPEDARLRRDLALKAALHAQELERADSSTQRSCLFCSSEFAGDRRQVLAHMRAAHGFNLGKADNLVFVDEFLQLLRTRLDQFTCLYCERVYKDRSTLKDHVRKKHHRKINPDNTAYDRFYMVNYATPSGESWQQGREIPDEDDDDNDGDDQAEDEELSDYAGSYGSAPTGSSAASSAVSDSLLGDIACLFCLHYASDLRSLNAHSVEEHGFDLVEVLAKLGFYWRVRLVNFVRHRVNKRMCVLCDAVFDRRELLLRHMTAERHFSVPERKIWSDVNYLFPTDEGDALLQQLAELDDDDDRGDAEESDGEVAVAEDMQPPDAEAFEELSRLVRDASTRDASAVV